MRLLWSSRWYCEMSMDSKWDLLAELRLLGFLCAEFEWLSSNHIVESTTTHCGPNLDLCNHVSLTQYLFTTVFLDVDKGFVTPAEHPKVVVEQHCRSLMNGLFLPCTNGPRTLLPVCSNGCPTTICKNLCRPSLRCSITSSENRFVKTLPGRGGMVT